MATKTDHHGTKKVSKKPALARKGVEEATKGKAPDRKTGGTKGRGRFGAMC